jgi:hypothetical protein
MTLDADEEIAQRALDQLKLLRRADPARVKSELTPIFHAMGNNSTAEHVRADAWLAVGAILKSYDEGSTEAPHLWDTAISKTAIWRQTFR